MSRFYYSFICTLLLLNACGGLDIADGAVDGGALPTKVDSGTTNSDEESQDDNRGYFYRKCSDRLQTKDPILMAECLDGMRTNAYFFVGKSDEEIRKDSEASYQKYWVKDARKRCTARFNNKDLPDSARLDEYNHNVIAIPDFLKGITRKQWMEVCVDTEITEFQYQQQQEINEDIASRNGIIEELEIEQRRLERAAGTLQSQ